MLFLAAASSFRPLITACSDGAGLCLDELPAFARDSFGVQGLGIHAGMLRGYDAPRLEALRRSADRGCCPCLALIEETPQGLASADASERAAGVDRIHRLQLAAARLGCGSVSISITGAPTDAGLASAKAALESLLPQTEKLEQHLLMTPAPGPLSTAKSVLACMKDLGAFRLGTAPDFEFAQLDADPHEHLRSLAPYARVVTASVGDFGPTGQHPVYDVVAATRALTSIGYNGAVMLEHRGTGDPVDAIARTQRMIEPEFSAADA